jgi:hypothetical protein
MQTKTARRVGFFRELDHGDEDGPSLRAMMSNMPLEHEADLCRYLNESPILLMSPATAADVIDPSVTIGPLVIRTDGDWAWPGDLAYYVERYHVHLVPEFVEHAASMNWRAPALDDAALESVTVFDAEPDDGAAGLKSSLERHA